MNRLIRTIEEVRAKLDTWRKHSIGETSTRTIVIYPLLQALGWDIRDPDEVQLEYPTIDGKAVDYALKINRRVVLLVEAKALGDPLTDVKAITQTVGYAANSGIARCILTNGARWRVYRSMEECPAPEKLMFEVSLDPRESQGLSVTQLAQQMWRLSREEVARGALEAIGEQTFTDGKVRRALDGIMREPSGSFLTLVKRMAGDEKLSRQQIKASLARVWGRQAEGEQAEGANLASLNALERPSRRQAALKAWDTMRRSAFDEQHHTAGKSREVIELYRSLDELCLSLRQGEIEKRFLRQTINYACGKHTFCCVHIKQGGLRVWLRLRYDRLDSPPSFARDVANIGHWGQGDLELSIRSAAELQEAAPLIRRSIEEQA